MHFSTSVVALLTLASTALAMDRPARQYRRDPSPERSNVLLPRIDVDHTLLCGDNYVDCNNGWCCSEGSTCETLKSVPVCKDPTQSFLGGTAPAYPFKSIDNVASSLAGVLSSFTAGQITATATGTHTGKATGTAAAATATNTGAAARLGAWGAAGVLGAGVMMVV